MRSSLSKVGHVHHFVWALVSISASACSSDGNRGAPGPDASVDASETGGTSAKGGAGGTGGTAASSGGQNVGGSGGKSSGGSAGGSTRLLEAGVERDGAPDATITPDAAADATPSRDASPRDATPSDALADAVAKGCTSVAVGTTFSSIYANLLSVKCVPCHTKHLQGTGSLPLQFPPNQAFDQGVDVAYADLLGANDGGGVEGEKAQGYACGSMGFRRVVPGDPDNSLIVEKLEGKDGTAQAICGERMPFQQPPICQPVIDAIRTWIANGALKN
ncbi:MAG TPA: hypothetical protein VHC69_27680 [Polyangiaceae bacterium]|nr:hypothetical protein [Polyangiaceae bacterium]